MARLLVDRALETVFIVAGLERDAAVEAEVQVRLAAASVGPDDFALIQTPEIGSLIETHVADQLFGVFAAESGAIAMRTTVRPDEIDDAVILLYDTGSTAEVLARATIWPFYGIKATSWTTEPDGSSVVSIVDGIDALEPAEVGFSEDLVRAWYILTAQPVVTHLLAVPKDAPDDEVTEIRTRLSNAVAAGYEDRREVRTALLDGSAAERERLVDCLSRVRFELDPVARSAAYSLIARGSGGTRFPLVRELPWRTGEPGDGDR